MVRTSVWLCTFFSLMVVSLLAGVDPANAASTAIKSKNQEVVLQPGQSITLSVPCGTAPGCGTNGFALFDANVNLSIQVVQCGLVTGDSCSVDVTGFFGQQVAAGSGATGRRGHGHPFPGEHESPCVRCRYQRP